MQQQGLLSAETVLAFILSAERGTFLQLPYTTMDAHCGTS